ncbi:hypothetical protein [Dactylosporangium salmoneum]|uniref:Uncharacterized protein n=1 Tax=Dactylosporangium salmoneum TaxID=53361 RepID=A0ABN3G8W7_9ACTN
MPTQLFTSETGRELAQRRHDVATPVQRKQNTANATAARAGVPATVADINTKVDVLGNLVLDQLAELRALRDEIAKLHSAHAAA